MEVGLGRGRSSAFVMRGGRIHDEGGEVWGSEIYHTVLYQVDIKWIEQSMVMGGQLSY